MKPFKYYNTYQTVYPNKKDYTTVYVYNVGKVVWEGDLCKFSVNNYPPPNVIQQVVNEEKYKEHLTMYLNEETKLTKEFIDDLFTEFRVKNNPKRFKCYNLAYERGHSNGFSEIYNEFCDLVELIIED